MISIKKYLDMDPASAGAAEAEELLKATLESYCSTILVMGKSGDRACPALVQACNKALGHWANASPIR